MLKLQHFAILCFLLKFSCICLCFNVQFRQFDDIKVETFERPKNVDNEMAHVLQKASYTFNGFEKHSSVPVLFPLDICLLQMNGNIYANCLHRNKDGALRLAVYKMTNNSYELMSEISTPKAIAMDCKSIDYKAFIAIVNNITNTLEATFEEASTIYELNNENLHAVQYFAAPNLVAMYFQVTASELYLLQTFHNTKSAPNIVCPYFKWTGATFDRIGHIPCSNARHLELFSMDYERYVAVANYADQRGRTRTYSELYKFEQTQQQFVLQQKIRTNGAVDVRYFSMPLTDLKKQHFLIFGNSISQSISTKQQADSLADSVFYVYENGMFVPYQRLTLYAVKQFLPLQSNEAEKLVLLVASKNQDIKIYKMKEGKFEEAAAQLTEGALGRGVSKMRTFFNQNRNHLVIANEQMLINETNVFLPIFKQDEQANALRTKILEWAKDNLQQLAAIDVKQLESQVQQKMQQLQLNKLPATEIKDIERSNIKSVFTKTLTYAPLHMNSAFWKSLLYANKALDVLDAHLVNKTQHQRKRRQASAQQQFQQLKVGKLIVKQQLNALQINGILAHAPNFQQIKATKAIIDGTCDIQTLQLQQLHINGTLNKHSMQQLKADALHKMGDQIIRAPMNISNLQTHELLINSNEMNAHDLNKLIAINANSSFVIEQDIQFAAPIEVHELLINERLKNLNIFQKKFDVLLKRCNETQMVEGLKRFEQLKVLTAIDVAGEILGAELQAIIPTKVLHAPLTLTGNYFINGSVLINKLLKAQDMLLRQSNSSLRHLLADSLRINEKLENVNLKFLEALQANNSMLNFVNAQDMQQLVRTGFDDLQLIAGEKTFLSSLRILNGFAEVKNLNSVNVEQLPKQLLLKNVEQNISAPMYFERVLAKGIHANNITLNALPVQNYLSKTSNQSIKGNLRLQQLQVQTLQLEHLNANAELFNQSMQQIYQQKHKNKPIPLLQQQQTFAGNIYVENLLLNDSINGQSVYEIERQLTQLNGNIKYVGNFKFNHAMHISNLSFVGSLNGIASEEFGKVWLQKWGAQSFTAPQTISTVLCQQDIKLAAHLNGYKLQDFYDKTYWLNRNEQLPHTSFASSIQLEGVLNTRSLNKLLVPEHLLFKHALQPQMLPSNAWVQQNFTINGGQIFNVTFLNDIHLPALVQFLQPTDSASRTLHLQHVHFDCAPNFQTLNGLQLQQTLNAVWLKNEDVQLQQRIEMAKANFAGLLEFEGDINQMNLEYLKAHYFSLSRRQTVTTPLKILQNAIFEAELKTQKMQINGGIIASESQTYFDFIEFVANTLKTAGAHEVRAPWTLLEANVQGDLQHTLINQLNFNTDVVRYDNALNIITANKLLLNANIQNLYVQTHSCVNGVNLLHWLNAAVQIYGNYTIQGTSILQAVQIFDNVNVLGDVNNMPFNANTLLLRTGVQHIAGNVSIQNHLAPILTLNFAHLQSELMNDVNLTKFFANLATQPNMLLPQHVQSHLIFEEPLLLQQYHLLADARDRAKRMTTNCTAAQLYENSNIFALDHVQVLQRLPVKTKNLFTQTIRLPAQQQSGNRDCIEMLVLQAADNDEAKFYQWHKLEQVYVQLPDLPSWQRNFSTLSLATLLHDQSYGNCLPSKDYKQLLQRAELLQQSLPTEQQWQFERAQLQQHNCLAIYNQNELRFKCAGMANMPRQQGYQMLSSKKGIKQLVSLCRNKIAILSADALEIWHLINGEQWQLEQRMPQNGAKQMTVAVQGEYVYLALLQLDLAEQRIKIYSALHDEPLHLLQTLLCPEAKQLLLQQLPASNDLLLHVLTEQLEMPLLMYQLQGMQGFVQLLSHSNLPRANKMQSLQLGQRFLLALFVEDALTLLQLALRPI